MDVGSAGTGMCEHGSEGLTGDRAAGVARPPRATKIKWGQTPFIRRPQLFDVGLKPDLTGRGREQRRREGWLDVPMASSI